VGLINWIFDIYQHSRIEDLHRQAEQARADTFALRQSGGSSPDHQRAIGELALAVKTMQRLAVQKGLCTQAEFQQVMEEIDREDGRVDGMARWK
jgi:hypothetical protein